MISRKQKIQYFLESTLKLIADKGMSCPSCGQNGFDVIDKKYLVTRLLRCKGCKLLFRAPTTTEKRFQEYYQASYKEGFTTELPTFEQLKKLKKSKFANTDKDYSKYITVLESLGCEQGSTILDFGCSWGYGSWQFAAAGYSVKSFEVSIRRSEFARSQLGINVLNSFDGVDHQFDVFFSSHVLEHIPKFADQIELARKIVRPGGWFVAFTPNGSLEYRTVNPLAWHSAWGFVHPIVLDEVFYQHFFRDSNYIIDSTPFNINAIADYAKSKTGSVVMDLSGAELMFAVQL